MENKNNSNFSPGQLPKKNQQECISGAAAINPQGENASSANISSVTKRDKDDNDKNSFKENRRKNTMSVAEWRKEGQKDKKSEPDTERKGSLHNKKSVEKHAEKESAKEDKAKDDLE